LREECARAALVNGAEVVVFGFVAFQGRGQELVDGDGAEAAAAQPAGLEDREVEGVESDERDEEVFGCLSEDSHGWALRRDIVKHLEEQLRALSYEPKSGGAMRTFLESCGPHFACRDLSTPLKMTFE
jgi:hypothetical protein